MKRRVSIIMVLTLAAASVKADEYQQAAEIFANVYVQEQVKLRLADYINKNPQIVGATNPEIGTQSMRVVGQLIAAYQFLNARNDKERAYAAMALMVPDPTAAMVIFAIQLSDMILTLRHQKDLVKTYERIALINKETTAIWTTILKESIKQQQATIQKFGQNLEEIQSLRKELSDSAIYQLLSGAENTLVTEENISRAIEVVFKLQSSITILINTFRKIEATVDLHLFEISDATVAEWREIVESYEVVEVDIKNLRSSFLNIFAITAAQSAMRSISEKVSEKTYDGAAYLACIEVFNERSRQILMSIEDEIDYAFLESCKEKFGLKWDFYDETLD